MSCRATPHPRLARFTAATLPRLAHPCQASSIVQFQTTLQITQSKHTSHLSSSSPCTPAIHTNTRSCRPPAGSGSLRSKAIPYKQAAVSTIHASRLEATSTTRLTISDLISGLDRSLCVDDNLLLAVDGDNLGRAIGRAAMVDQAPARKQGQVAKGLAPPRL